MKRRASIFPADTKTALIAVFIAIVIKLLLILWSVWQFPSSQYSQPNFVGLWNRWDSGSYVHIAQFLYGPGGDEELRQFVCHFPPLYPYAIRRLSVLTGLSLPAAAFSVSLICGLIASYFLAKVMLYEYGSRRAALLSVFFFNIYPTAYFMTAAYSESMYLMFVILMFYWMRCRGSLWGAAVASAAALLTRTSGITTIPVLGVDLLIGIRSGRRRLRDLAAFILPAGAVFIYLAINRYYYGSWLYFLEHYGASPYTQKVSMLPLVETAATIRKMALDIYSSNWDALYWNSEQMMTLGWSSLFTVVALGFTLFAVCRRLPVEYTVYALFTVLFYSSFRWGISNARFSLAVIPIFMVLGQLEKKRWVFFWSALFIPLLLMFTARFTSGFWAF